MLTSPLYCSNKVLLELIETWNEEIQYNPYSSCIVANAMKEEADDANQERFVELHKT
jgi:hypothetical protein